MKGLGCLIACVLATNIGSAARAEEAREIDLAAWERLNGQGARMGQQPAAASENLAGADDKHVQRSGRILAAQDGQLIGPPRYASREKIGSATVVTFVASPPRVGPNFGSLSKDMPISGRLSSSFGYRVHPILGGLRWHRGIDLAAPAGTPVHATSDGRVERADRDGGFGLMVELDDGVGTETLYGHMSRIAVTKGASVKKGDVIGYVGSTGLSTGPHLHYEIRRNGTSVNPVGGQSAHADGNRLGR